jgi:dTMP kinase
LVGQRIRPTLESGGTVLCDRYADSTLAYQGYGHGLDLETLRLITSFATQGLRPDLTLLCDLEPALGLKRRQADGVEWNRLDDYDLAFHQRVRQGYHELAQADPGRWVTLDATLGRQKLQEEVRRVVAERLEVRSQKSEIGS